jgi:MbtH protein
MTIMFSDESQDFDVVVNVEEQYSIWPSGRELPAGWRRAGFRGSKSDCLSHIDTVWTDITPLSARQ